MIKFKKLVYEHLSYPNFVSTIEFESRGDQTHLSWQMLFESKEELIQVVKTFKADEGLKQNVEKLEKYLSKGVTL